MAVHIQYFISVTMKAVVRITFYIDQNTRLIPTVPQVQIQPR